VELRSKAVEILCVVIPVKRPGHQFTSAARCPQIRYPHSLQLEAKTRFR